MRLRPPPHACPRLLAGPLLGVALVLLAGCLSLPAKQAAAPAPAGGLADLMERPAERALFEGLRAYDEGQYAQAEAALQRALQTGLASPRDQASAHKLLAFITCTSERLDACEAAFRAARAADPGFTLSRAETGHPLWGPVYQRVVTGATAATVPATSAAPSPTTPGTTPAAASAPAAR